MKKVFISMFVVAAASLMTGSACAQSTDQKAKQECCDTTGNAKGKSLKKDGRKDFERRDRQTQYNPFEGMELTEDQQQRLAVLQKGLGPALVDAPEKSLPDNMSDEQKAKIKKDMASRKVEAKKNYLNGVKEIIGPEQYVVFLENFYINAPSQKQGQRPDKNRADMKKRDGKDLKKHDGKRPERGEKKERKVEKK